MYTIKELFSKLSQLSFLSLPPYTIAHTTLSIWRQSNSSKAPCSPCLLPLLPARFSSLIRTLSHHTPLTTCFYSVPLFSFVLYLFSLLCASNFPYLGFTSCAISAEAQGDNSCRSCSVMLGCSTATRVCTGNRRTGISLNLTLVVFIS